MYRWVCEGVADGCVVVSLGLGGVEGVGGFGCCVVSFVVVEYVVISGFLFTIKKKVNWVVVKREGRTYMMYQPSNTSAAKPTKPPTAPPTMGAMFVLCDFFVAVGGALIVVAGNVEVLVRVAVDTLPSDMVVYD